MHRKVALTAKCCLLPLVVVVKILLLLLVVFVGPYHQCLVCHHRESGQLCRCPAAAAAALRLLVVLAVIQPWHLVNLLNSVLNSVWIPVGFQFVVLYRVETVGLWPVGLLCSVL